MSVFADLTETRQLGAPIVGLFRTALARDPDPLEMARLAPEIRNRTPLATIAATITAGPEFLHRYAGIVPGERAECFLRNAFGPIQAGLEDTRRVADWAGTDAELIALVTDAALTRDAIPLLPGLVPGAAPDDDVAYRLWVSEYDQPRTAAHAGSDALVSLLMKAGDTEAEAAERSVASLIRQTHPHWELCLAARTISPWSQQTIQALARDEPRVRLIDEYDVAAALGASTGSLVGIMSPGDTLALDALARVTNAFEPSVGLVFTDEDVEDASGRHSPRFKPGFSPDRPLAVGGLAIARRDLLDLARVTAPAVVARHLDPSQVRHVPVIALHRATVPSTIDPDIFAGAPVAVPQPAPRVTVSC